VDRGVRRTLTASLWSFSSTPALGRRSFTSTDHWGWRCWNRFVDNVMTLVRAKVEGTATPVAAPVTPKPIADLAAMLQASLAAANVDTL